LWVLPTIESLSHSGHIGGGFLISEKQGGHKYWPSFPHPKHFLGKKTSMMPIVGGEAWLINANVPVLGSSKYDSKRSRKLLLHKNEIVSIGTKVKQQKLTLLPVAVYTKGRFVKAELALAKPKKEFEKREDIKRKDIERDLAQELRVKD